MRNPLDKECFLCGNRQKWTGILLLYGILLMILQIVCKLDTAPYIQYAMTLGSLFLVGGSVDSAMKINAAKPKQTTETDEGTN
jgi:hypothetical protein